MHVYMDQRISFTQSRIMERLKEQGVSQSMIAKALGLHQSAVSNLANGKRNLKWDEAATLIGMLPGHTMPVRELPVIGMAGAGNWLEAIEYADEMIGLPDENVMPGKFAVRVGGDSMNLLLPEGSFAVVDPEQRDLFVGKLYLLINGEGEATIKRYRADPARFEPVSDNPAYEAFSVSSVSFRVIGQVTGGVQSFR